MQIGKHAVVTMDYTLTNDNGQVIDSSSDGEPLAYIHGIGNIIPGLEQALEGKNIGDNVKATIAAADAYGEHNPEAIQLVPKEAFEGMGDLEVGMRFHAETAQGYQVVRISAIEGDTVHVDGNHELAGQTLHFDVVIRDVREATQEELEHGHVHGAGGHHH